jgi:hypothetical protein
MEEIRADDEVEIHKESGLSLTGLQEVLEKSDQIVDYFKDNDPFSDSTAKFERGMKDLLSPYLTILNEKLHRRKQTTLDSFFKKPVKEKSVMRREPNDPQPGPSGL